MKFEQFDLRIMSGRPVRRTSLGELPPLSFEPLSLRQWETAARGSIASEQKAASERFKPTSSTHYGLLGGRFIPTDGEHLRVAVASTASTGRPEWNVPEPHAMPWGSVYIGLRIEFVGAVLEGAQTTEALGLLGPGVLRFDCAAWSELASNRSLFRILARDVVTVITRTSPDSTEDEIRALLDG